MPEMLGDFEVHNQPSGHTVYYRDSNHAYYSRIEERKGGKWVGPRDAYLPSPSTIGKVLDGSPDGLMRWAARQTCNGVVQLREVPEDGDALWGRLCAAKLTYNDLKEKRGQEGTNVHEKVLACLAAGERIPSLSDVSAEERGYAQGVFAAWHELEPEPVASELVVYSHTHGFAGRVDLVCRIGGKLTILDLKTGYVGNGAHTQLAGYLLALEDGGHGHAADALILKVESGGGYDVTPCAADPDDFLAALAAYRSASKVGKRSRELAKAA
jgi:hypothetical protein